MGGDGGGGVEDDAAPDLAAGEGEGGQVDAGDNAEVVGAAFEDLPQIGVGLGVGGDGFAGGEDDLEVFDVVADEAVAGGEEGVAACIRSAQIRLMMDSGQTSNGQASDANCCRSTSWYGNSFRRQVIIHLSPSRPGSNRCCVAIPIFVQRYRIQFAQVDCDARRGNVIVRERIVTTAPDGKSAGVLYKDIGHIGDSLRGGGCDDAAWVRSGL